MDNLIENTSKIISEAAKSPLGICALLIMAVSVLAWLFFGESADIYKVPVFLAVLAVFVIVVHYVHSYRESQASEQVDEKKDEIVETHLTQLPEIADVIWCDPSEKDRKYALTAIEARILESLRGKPDVRWTKELIIISSRNSLAFSRRELLKGVDELEKKNYIASNKDGIYHVLDLAILYYRSTMESNAYELDEADYWDGT